MLEELQADELLNHPADEESDKDFLEALVLNQPAALTYQRLLHPDLDVASGCATSKEFFFRDQIHGNGIKYLAGTAQFGSAVNIPPDSLDDNEVKMMMQTAELAYSLPKSDRV